MSKVMRDEEDYRDLIFLPVRYGQPPPLVCRLSVHSPHPSAHVHRSLSGPEVNCRSGLGTARLYQTNASVVRGAGNEGEGGIGVAQEAERANGAARHTAWHIHAEWDLNIILHKHQTNMKLKDNFKNDIKRKSHQMFWFPPPHFHLEPCLQAQSCNLLAQEIKKHEKNKIYRLVSQDKKIKMKWIGHIILRKILVIESFLSSKFPQVFVLPPPLPSTQPCPAGTPLRRLWSLFANYSPSKQRNTRMMTSI